MKIRPAVKRWMTGKSDLNTKIDLIVTDSGVNRETVERLLKLSIKKLLTMELDIDTLNKEVKELEKNLKNIDSYILEQYNSL
jgi:hypothetical protein